MEMNRSKWVVVVYCIVVITVGAEFCNTIYSYPFSNDNHSFSLNFYLLIFKGNSFMSSCSLSSSSFIINGSKNHRIHTIWMVTTLNSNLIFKISMFGFYHFHICFILYYIYIAYPYKTSLDLY